MTAVLLTILTMTVVGLPLTLAIDRTARGPKLLGLSFLYGNAAAMFALLLLSVAGIPWSAVTAISGLILFGVAARLVARSKGRGATELAAAPPPAGPRSPLARPHFLDLITVAFLTSYVFYVTIAPLWDWDFWAIWGLKARVFLEHGGIDWTWLANPWNEFAHPDYPVLVTFTYDFAALLNGAWSDRWLGLFFAAWAVATLLIVRGLTADEAPAWVSAAATAASALVAMSMYIGMAEGALIAFASTGLLFQRRALGERSSPGDQRHAALLLGLAANCKNEGIALLTATAIAVVLTDPRRWKRVTRLWPALALLAPWMLLRATHALPTDIASGNLLGRFFERFAHLGEIFAELERLLVDPWSWCVLIVTFLIVPHAARRERFIVVVTGVQLAFYVATYFVTPHDVTWHIATSWQRLPRQMQLPLTVVCMLLLAQFAMRGEDAPDAAP